jgi:hypothetical protein
VLLGVVALLGWHGGRGGRRRRAQLLGVASGMGFALSAVFISADLANGFGWFLLVQWQTYAMLGSSIVAMVCLQWGMQAGTLVAVQPGVTLADPVVAIALGTALFGESVRGGLWLVPAVIAGVAVVYEVFALSRSEAILEQLETAEGHTPDEPHVVAPAVGPLARRAAAHWPPPNGSTRATPEQLRGATVARPDAHRRSA